MTLLANTRSGLNNVAEYQASGLPWVQTGTITGGSTTRIDFPMVTNRIVIKAGGDLRFGFTENGVANSNYYLLNTSESISFDLRLKTLFLRADTNTTYYVLAGLTQISSNYFPVLSGSATYNSGSITFEYGYGVAGDPGAGSGLG